MRFFVLPAIVALVAAIGTAPAGASPTGDQILARAALLRGVRSYTVPVRFDVHLHKPIGLRANVEGVVNYQGPRAGALVITKAHGIIGGFFKGTYHLDLVPQTWPAIYHVTSVAVENGPDGPVTVLKATPRVDPGDITQVTFRIGGRAVAPIAATWNYSDGSSIALTFDNGRVGPGALPQTATVHVDKPGDKLDATVTYGEYALNAPIDPAILATK
jgi:hypothetical protein